MAFTIQIRRNTTAAIPILANGELYLAVDTQKLYVGLSGNNYLIGGASGGAFPIPIPISWGGQGNLTLPAHGVLAGEGTSGINSVLGNMGQALISQGSGIDPAFGKTLMGGRWTGTNKAPFIRYQQQLSSKVGSVTFTPPGIPNCLDGDYLVAIAVYDDNTDDVATPSGWTLVEHSTSSPRMYVWTKVAQGEGSTSYTFTGNATSALSIQFLVVGNTVGVDVHGSSLSPGFGSSYNAPDVTTTGPADLVFFAWGTIGASQNTITGPGGSVSDISSFSTSSPDGLRSDYASLLVSYQMFAAAGSTGNKTATGSSQNFNGVTVAFLPAAARVTTPIQPTQKFIGIDSEIPTLADGQDGFSIDKQNYYIGLSGTNYKINGVASGNVISGTIASGALPNIVLSGGLDGSGIGGGIFTKFSLTGDVIGSGILGIVSGVLNISGMTAGDVGLADKFPELNSGAGANRSVTFDRIAGFIAPAEINDFRLSPLSGVAIPSTDQTKVGTIYLTPCDQGVAQSGITSGNGRIVLYDGTRWRLYATSQQSISIASVNSGSVYDVFAYDNAGTVTLQTVAWSSTTLRATALNMMDGVLLKQGDLTKRYLGTFFANGSGTTEDSANYRYIWNKDNQKKRTLYYVDQGTSSWNYTSGIWRQANGNAAYQVGVMQGLAYSSLVQIDVCGAMSLSAGTGAGYVGVGEDQSGTFAPEALNQPAQLYVQATATATMNRSLLIKNPPLGQHTYQWLEYGDANATFYSTAGVPDRFQCGIRGHWDC